MRYLSIDIETTGLDPETCQILEIGAILEDTKLCLPREECPTFHCYIHHPLLNMELGAAVMNAGILAKIQELQKEKSPILLSPGLVMSEFINFLNANNINTRKVLVAGKNFSGFDKRFLVKLPHASRINFMQRVLDPATLYTDFEYDEFPPGLEECKRRAGIEGAITHNACDDSWDVIALLRRIYVRLP